MTQVGQEALGHVAPADLADAHAVADAPRAADRQGLGDRRRAVRLAGVDGDREEFVAVV